MKKTSKIKRLATLGLIFLLSINSFAATTGDNDGSAFITKAEFDSLKNNFQAQIDTYNQGIDSKIDSAIAAYLSGVKINKEPYNILETLNGALGGQVWFKNNFYDIGQSNIDTNLNLNFTRHYTYQYNDNIVWTVKFGWSGDKTQHLSTNRCVYGCGLYLDHVDYDGKCDYRIAYAEGTKYDTLDWSYNYYNYDDQGYTWNKGSATLTPGWSKAHASKTNVNNASSQSTAGSGKAWIFEVKPSGRLTLKQFANTLYPRQNIEIVSHTYKNLYITSRNDWATFESIYCTPGGRKDTTNLGTINIPSMSGWNEKEDGTKITGTSTSAKEQYYRINQVMIKSTDGEDYSIYMWGKNADTGLYCQNMNAVPTVGAKDSTWTADKTKSTFPIETYRTYTVTLDDNELSGQAFTYYPITMSTDYLNAKSVFSNDYVSQVAGEDVHIGDGIPILKTADADQKIHIKVKFKVKGATSNPNIKYMISDKKFNNNALSSGATLLKSGTAVKGTEYEFDIQTSEQDQYVWFTCYADTADNTDAAIDTFECKQVS